MASADPVLSVDVTTLPGEDYDAALQMIRELGASATSLSLMWDEAEATPGEYSADPDWPLIANAYYPGQGFSLSLTFSVIDTVADRRPADLKGRDWADAALATRFADYVQAVLDRMQDVDIKVISVGNEVDASLPTEDIAGYARFLARARDRIHTLRPGVPVGVKLTLDGLLADPAKWHPLLAASDAILVTYYPLTPDFVLRPPAEVGADLDRLVALAGDEARPAYILEAGYPSEGCGATPIGQVEFLQGLMAAWQRHARTIPLVTITWLTDLSAQEVEGYAGYYGVGADCFRRYLATLGLRDATGSPKPAMEWLKSRSASGFPG